MAVPFNPDRLRMSDLELLEVDGSILTPARDVPGCKGSKILDLGEDPAGGIHIDTVHILLDLLMIRPGENLPINTSTTNSSTNSLRLEAKTLEGFDVPGCQGS